jgi:hypothetical protein
MDFPAHAHAALVEAAVTSTAQPGVYEWHDLGWITCAIALACLALFAAALFQLSKRYL